MYKILVDGNVICDSRIEELAVIDPVVKNKVNSAGSFTFTMPPTHPDYGIIKRRKSLITVLQEEEIIFQGIAVEEAKDFFNQATYVCEGELTYFNDSIQRQAHYKGLTCRQLLETYVSVHNSQVEEEKQFTVGIVNVQDDYITCYTNMETTMTSLKEDLVDDLGGYFRIRYADGKKYIDYLADSLHTSDQVIALGENLIDYSSNINNTDIATSIIPLGARLETSAVEGLEQRLDIKSVNDGKDYVASATAIENYGTITKVVTWDDVTDANNLKTKGEKYLADIQFENVIIKASAVDFGMISDEYEKFKLLDKIRVVSPAHGMDRFFLLSEQTLNLNEPEKDTIVLGLTEKLGLSAKTQQTSQSILKQIEQMPSSTAMKEAINNATALLRGAEGGHVLINTNADGEPYEILIMDTDNVETATKVWRWNQNGLGYSDTGYDGEYGLAMTIDGEIVANKITTGILKGGDSSWNLDTGEMDITGKFHHSTPDGVKSIDIVNNLIRFYAWDENGEPVGLVGSGTQGQRHAITMFSEHDDMVALGYRTAEGQGRTMFSIDATKPDDVPYIRNTANGTLFDYTDAGGNEIGITVSNGLIKDWKMPSMNTELLGFLKVQGGLITGWNQKSYITGDGIATSHDHGLATKAVTGVTDSIGVMTNVFWDTATGKVTGTTGGNLIFEDGIYKGFQSW